jgi:cytochrome c oxidase cbb3-type subunit 4
MDINDLRGVSTLFMLVTFIGLVVWAYGRKQQEPFDDAANLPFADQEVAERTRTEVLDRD